MRLNHPDRILGLICILFALVLIFLWAPTDSGSWIVEKVRRKWRIGDAAAPVFAGTIFLVAGLLLLIQKTAVDAPRLDGKHLRFLAVVTGIIVAGLVLMRWTGPLAADLFSDIEYRLLRDTVPWKYLGFAPGGFLIVAGLIIFVEGRLSLRAIWIGVFAVTAIITLYDLPFDDLLLPPNGDV